MHQRRLVTISVLHSKRLRIRNRVRVLRILTFAQPTPDRTGATHAITATAVLQIIVRSFLRGSEQLGERADEHDAKRRHTSAYDADVDFDVRPVDYVGLVPGGVLGSAEVDEGLESER